MLSIVSGSFIEIFVSFSFQRLRWRRRILRTSALSFQLRFGSNFSFAYSFGKREPAWQKISKPCGGLRGSQNAGVFSKTSRDVRFASANKVQNSGVLLEDFGFEVDEIHKMTRRDFVNRNM